MVQVTVTAGIPLDNRKKGQQRLRIRSVQERPLVPPAGSTLVIQSPKSSGGRRIRLTVVSSDHVWKKGEESYEVSARTDFDNLKYLLFVEEWELVDGIEELSPDQQGEIRCRQGTCDHDHHKRS